MLYEVDCWATKKQHKHKMGVTEIRMFSWMCGHLSMDKIKNEDL